MSFTLPDHESLPVNLLAASLKNTSSTYKYYWLLSIVELVELGEKQIDKSRIFARMVSNSWFTINYFNVSFGKQDKLQRAVQNIKTIENLAIDCNREKLFNILQNTNQINTQAELHYFDTNVPHWFLTPWYPKKSKHDIYLLSKEKNSKPLYFLEKNKIIINGIWVEYIQSNAKILKDFCYWNLTLYLQSKNPNVPDIPNKLIKPASRNSLSSQKKQFWDIVIASMGSVECIYTGKKLMQGEYALDHFIPYSFVSHDLMWNLIPSEKGFNICKSNRLPILNKHFTNFFNLQRKAVEIMLDRNPQNKYLEEYLTIFWDLSDSTNLPKFFTRERFIEKIQPLITIASNNGFEFLT